MNLQDIAAIASAIAALSAVGATYFAAVAVRVATAGQKAMAAQVAAMQTQLDASHRVHEMDVHLRFQADLRAIQRMLPQSVNDKAWRPQTEEHRRAISLYWYLVFDEWMTCNTFAIKLPGLWERYAIGVKAALHLPAYHDAVRELFSGGASLLGHGAAFKAEIQQLAMDAHVGPVT